ncbi:unnamed protein product [Schistosoma rodhaini]|uniref:Uncharacterized protein n=1 Tax=Schistosoma rodhaini TaxID=6188 RepID=A0AA85GFQ9_9TREM|nr:unnamed protein product [Schistosoma rodhaini]
MSEISNKTGNINHENGQVKKMGRSVDEQHLALRKSYSSKTLFQQIAWRSLDNSRRQKNMLTGDYAEPLWAMVLDKKMEINHIPVRTFRLP